MEGRCDTWKVAGDAVMKGGWAAACGRIAKTSSCRFLPYSSASSLRTERIATWAVVSRGASAVLRQTNAIVCHVDTQGCGLPRGHRGADCHVDTQGRGLPRGQRGADCHVDRVVVAAAVPVWARAGVAAT